MTLGDETPEQMSAARGALYGDFDDNARIAVYLRQYWRNQPNWDQLNRAQKLALDESALKIARILSSGANPNYPDNWIDIAGYATLGAKACKRKE